MAYEDENIYAPAYRALTSGSNANRGNAFNDWMNDSAAPAVGRTLTRMSPSYARAAQASGLPATDFDAQYFSPSAKTQAGASAAEQPAYAPKGVTAGGMPSRFTADGVDIPGSAARVRGDSGAPRGTNVYNTYDQDRPASMGASGNDPWRDMARQLATFSALRSRDQQTPGYNSLPDYAAQQNAEFDARHAVDPSGLSKREAARLNMAAMKERGDQRAQDMTAGIAMNRNAIAERGQQLDYQGRLEGIGLQGRNNLAVAGMQGQNHLAAVGLQGRNQLDNTQLHGLLSYQQAMDTQHAKSTAEASDPYRQALAESAKQHGRYYGRMADTAAADAVYGKTPHGMMAREVQSLPKLVESGILSPEDAKRRMAELQAAAYAHDARSKKQKDDPASKFADGGAVVDPAEELIRRMREKYGAAPSTPQEPPPQRPQVQPAPAPQPVPQQGQGIFGLIRGRAAQIDKASGYADGGPIDVSGRQVLGAGTPKSDSLPAIIDGEHPAALSTDEFVMPVEAVRYFGLAKLNKMIEQSRRGLDTGRQQA